MTANPVTEALVYTAIAVFVTFVSQKIIKMYTDWRRLPPGPFPWPLIGNIVHFRQNLFAHEVVNQLAEKYGPVVTMFFGHDPNVFITDPEIGIQVLKKHQFAGRPKLFLEDIFCDKGSIDIVLADWGKEWEALRKVGHSAARKYAVSHKLAPSVNGVVDRAIELASEKPIDSEELCGLMMTSILAEAAFGKKYDFNDKEFQDWRYAANVGLRRSRAFLVIIVLPAIRHFLFSAWKELKECMAYQKSYINKMFAKAVEEYSEGKNDTFCDAIITAKNEAEAEENWMTPYLHPTNMRNAIADLFSAGSDTTKSTLRWIFVMMSAHPEMQEKLRTEVNAIIASSQDPQLEDRAKCNFVCAFIAETMRFRSIVPFAVPHKTTVDVELNGHQIPQGTTIHVSLHNALHDSKVWGDPETFRPDRFLDANGKFVSRPNPYYIPFGDGRRSCPGNKLALNDMFLVVARFLQKTKTIGIVGGVTKELMRGDLNQSNFIPVNFEIQLTLK